MLRPFTIFATVGLIAGCIEEAPDRYKRRPAPIEDTAQPIVQTVDMADAPEDTDVPELAVFDCATTLDSPGSPTRLDAPRGYNDVVFTDDGSMVGWDGFVLRRASDTETFDVYAPGVDMVYKLGRLPDGDLVATLADDQVIRVEPDGNRYPIAWDVNGYGLAVGSDGNVYVGTNGGAGAPGIVRIDPDTQETEVLLELAATPPRDIDFSRDFSVLYFGTVDNGHVFKVPLDANLDPTGDPELIATVPASWHDTLEVDACGNIYVGGLFGQEYYRLRTDGTMELFMEFTFDTWAHGFQWGDPKGGWDPLSIYMAHPDVGKQVNEVFIGVPGRLWEGEVIGGATL